MKLFGLLEICSTSWRNLMLCTSWQTLLIYQRLLSISITSFKFFFLLISLIFLSPSFNNFPVSILYLNGCYIYKVYHILCRMWSHTSSASCLTSSFASNALCLMCSLASNVLCLMCFLSSCTLYSAFPCVSCAFYFTYCCTLFAALCPLCSCTPHVPLAPDVLYLICFAAVWVFFSLITTI